MATLKPKRKSGLKRAPAKRTPRKAKPGTRGLLPAECQLDSLPAEAEEVRARIEREGGLMLGAYNDPLGKNPLIFAILPIDRIEPTPSFQPDCVVLDVQMPGMNGLEVQERLASSGNPLPVIFITAHDDLGVRDRALAAGAVAFLRKPFNDKLFIKTLRVALKEDTDE